VGLRINQNVMAMNAYRNLTTSEGQLSRSLERLSSGYRINRAADDAAGLVISEGLRSQVMGLKMATRNAQDGVSVVQTAEGALTETHSILQRIRELAIQAASTGSSDAPSRQAAQVEVAQLKSELDRIGNTTKFGAQTLLAGGYGTTNSVARTSTGTVSVAAGVTDKFSVDLDGAGALAAIDITLTGTRVYDATIAGDAAGLEGNINAALNTALAPYFGSSPITAKVTVSGANFVTTFSSTNLSTTFSVGLGSATDVGADLLTAGATSAITGSGGTFQVGAGVGETINITINDVRTNALGLTAVDVSNAALSGANLNALDNAVSTVSTLRGQLGAYQNRFEHTIANLSVTTENLSASESRIRDTDMAAEMMSFTRAQILQQAGTAMLAQANAVPQGVLQLLKGN
jgi:flagellin